MSSQASPEPRNPSQSYGFAMIVAATIFFLFGFATSLNTSVLQPHLKNIFTLTYFQAMLVQSAFFSAYFILSLPAAGIMGRLGYQKSMVLGLAVMAVGALLFYPAATTISYGVFLSAVFVLAAGVTMLQVAANPFVTQLGPPALSSSRMNLVQAFNSVATASAPIVGGIFFLSKDVATKAGGTMSSANQVTAANAVKGVYIGMAIILAILAFILNRLRLNLPEHVQGRTVASSDSIWRHSHLILGALGIFCYVGAEVSIGSILVNYLHQQNILGLAENTAANYVAVYWGLMIIGRFAGTAILRKVASGTVLSTAAAAALILVLVTMFTGGALAGFAAVAVGLFNSVMFPTIFSLAVVDLGPLTGKGSGLINMAIVGGAALPPLQGYLADTIGIQMSFLVPAICYLYILSYGITGHKVRSAAA